KQTAKHEARTPRFGRQNGPPMRTSGHSVSVHDRQTITCRVALRQSIRLESGERSSRPARSMSGMEKGFGMDELNTLVRSILDDFYVSHPTEARWLGLHQYDGVVADNSPTGLKARLERITTQLA